MIHILLLIVYFAFISLGLPDSVLGSAWPTMYPGFGVPVSYAGIVSMIIAVGTIISSLMSDWATKRLGVGMVTAISVTMTALALFGFNISSEFWMLCLWAIPYGLGAGSVDAALNNFVALHYASRHMSWLHAMWGVGTVIGPCIMGYVLTNGQQWNNGYLYISIIQIALSVILFISLPLWRKKSQSITKTENGEAVSGEVIPLSKIVRFRGVKDIMLAFFCYCGLEATAMLWSGSYLVLHDGISPERAAGLASSFFIGITVGRMLSGFMTFKFNDTQMIRIGQTLIAVGCMILMIPMNYILTFVGIIIIGLGCAPVYPCIIHSTPIHFGADKSQAIIGVQMASAYVGTCLMPPLFGLIANHISVGLMPIYMLILNILMFVSYQRLIKKKSR